eukprot:COSAG01_NODE_1130_length_11575_cov_6.349773_8_plen_88_part_00
MWVCRYHGEAYIKKALEKAEKEKRAKIKKLKALSVRVRVALEFESPFSVEVVSDCEYCHAKCLACTSSRCLVCSYMLYVWCIMFVCT